MDHKQLKALAEEHGAIFRDDDEAVVLWHQKDFQAYNMAFRELLRPKKEWKGCSSCFGSGGKKTDPCKFCNGTGKIPLAQK